MWPPSAPFPRLTRGRREQRSDGLHQCRRARWPHSAYKESGNRSMTWRQPKPERPWISSARSGKHCYHSRNQLLYLCAGESNTDKDQSQFTGAKLDPIISNKKKVFCFVIDHLLCIYDFPFILLLLWTLWILVFFIPFIGLWNLYSCVTILWCSLHILCCMCQEVRRWNTLNMKHIWRAWACMMLDV